MNWINTNVQEMIHLYGVMLQISIDPHHLGGYTSYFESISRINCGQGYTFTFEAYRGWDSKLMSLSNFRKICSEYNPEFGESKVGDKCRQLIFMVWCINQAPARTFDIGLNEAFDEGVISTCSCFSSVR